MSAANVYEADLAVQSPTGSAHADRALMPRMYRYGQAYRRYAFEIEDGHRAFHPALVAADLIQPFWLVVGQTAHRERLALQFDTREEALCAWCKLGEPHALLVDVSAAWDAGSTRFSWDAEVDQLADSYRDHDITPADVAEMGEKR